MSPRAGSVRTKKVRAGCRAGDAFIEPLEHRLLFSKPFGTPDPTFGTGGFASVDIPSASSSTLTFGQLVVDSAGNIYAGGSAGIARLTSAGAVDDSFGSAGLAALPSGDMFIAEAVDPQGGIYALLKSSGSSLLADYTSAGVLDTSYGQDGIVQVTSDTNFTPTCITVQSDGDPIIAGTATISTGSGSSATKGAEMRVLRLNADGSLDSSFGTDGSLSAYMGTSTSLTPIISDEVAGVKTLPNGDILVGGGSASLTSGGAGETPYFAAAEITPSGELDSAYGADGIAISPIPGTLNYGSTHLYVTGFDARSDGSVVFAGSIYPFAESGTNYAAAADASGTFDYDVTLSSDAIGGGRVFGIAALGDGRSVVISGDYYYPFGLDASPLGDDVALTPIASDGTPGQTVTTYNASTDSSTLSSASSASIVVAPSGRIVVGAVAINGGGYSLEQVDEGTASAPRTDNFADGTINSIAIPGYVLDESTSDYGSSPGFAVDLAYYNSTTETLMFAQRLNNGLWDAPITVDSTEGAGEYLSLATDSNGNPSIAFYDKKSESLKFASSTNGGRSFKITTLDASGNVGLYPSLVFNNDTPELAYYDETDGTLKFATTNSKGKWVVSTVDSKGNVGREASIALTPSGRVSIAYLDSTLGEIKWAAQNANGTWEFKDAAKVHQGTDAISMTYSPDSEDLEFNQDPVIVYHDLASNELRETVYNNRFTARTIATDEGQYVGVAPGLGDDQTLSAVFAYDKATDSLVVYPGGEDPPYSSTIVDGGGRYVTVVEDGIVGGLRIVLAAYVDSATGDLEVRPFDVDVPNS